MPKSCFKTKMFVGKSWVENKMSEEKTSLETKYWYLQRLMENPPLDFVAKSFLQHSSECSLWFWNGDVALPKFPSAGDGSRSIFPIEQNWTNLNIMISILREMLLLSVIQKRRIWPWKILMWSHTKIALESHSATCCTGYLAEGPWGCTQNLNLESRACHPDFSWLHKTYLRVAASKQRDLDGAPGTWIWIVALATQIFLGHTKHTSVCSSLTPGFCWVRLPPTEVSFV